MHRPYLVVWFATGLWLALLANCEGSLITLDNCVIAASASSADLASSFSDSSQVNLDLAEQQIAQTIILSPSPGLASPPRENSSNLTDSSIFQGIVGVALLGLVGASYKFFCRNNQRQRGRQSLIFTPEIIRSENSRLQLQSVIAEHQHMCDRMAKLEAELTNQQQVGPEQVTFAFGQQVDELRQEALNQGETIRQLQTLLQQLLSQMSRQLEPSGGESQLALLTSEEAQIAVAECNCTLNLFLIVDTVTLTEESLANLWLGKDDPPEFESNGQGNYVIINNLASNRQSYYLAPESRFLLNQYNLETLAHLYCFENAPTSDGSFTLIKLAEVLPQNNQGIWRLAELGRLVFGEVSPLEAQTSLPSQLLNVETELKDLQAVLQAEQQIKQQKDQKLNVDLQGISTRLDDLTRQLEELQRATPETLPNWLAHNSQPLNQLSDKLPEQAVERAIVVGATEESANRLFSGQEQSVIFETQANGKYWLLKGYLSENGERFDYLVLRDKVKFHPSSLDLMRACFDVLNPEFAHTAEFEVIRPAIVSPIGTQAQWKLIERGQLKFQLHEQIENHA